MHVPGPVSPRTCHVSLDKLLNGFLLVLSFKMREITASHLLGDDFGGELLITVFSVSNILSA